jgi:integrase
MPRRAQGPRLYLDQRRKQWIVRDGQSFSRTGRAESDREGAEKRLAEYIVAKYRPAASPSPLIADVLLAYSREHLPNVPSGANTAWNVKNLVAFWGTKKVDFVTPNNCQDYAVSKSAGGARRDLEVLRAAIHYWDRHYGPLSSVPAVHLPKKSQPKERWLTRPEARALRHASKNTPHLYRFIVIGLLTGSRSGAITNLEWNWIDLERGLMRRRALGSSETNKRTPTVRLGRKLLTLLRRWKRLDDEKSKWVCHYDGRRVLKVRRSWATAIAQAGLGRDVTPHTLRHTRATWLMQQGIDPWEAAGHLGMSVETLQRVYGKHHPDYQKNAAEV